MAQSLAHSQTTTTHTHLCHPAMHPHPCQQPIHAHPCHRPHAQVLDNLSHRIITTHLPPLHRLVDGVALLDMLCGFARFACGSEGYVRPTLTEQGPLAIVGGRQVGGLVQGEGHGSAARRSHLVHFVQTIITPPSWHTHVRAPHTHTHTHTHRERERGTPAGTLCWSNWTLAHTPTSQTTPTLPSAAAATSSQDPT